MCKDGSEEEVPAVQWFTEHSASHELNPRWMLAMGHCQSFLPHIFARMPSNCPKYPKYFSPAGLVYLPEYILFLYFQSKGHLAFHINLWTCTKCPKKFSQYSMINRGGASLHRAGGRIILGAIVDDNLWTECWWWSAKVKCPRLSIRQEEQHSIPGWQEQASHSEKCHHLKKCHLRSNTEDRAEWWTLGATTHLCEANLLYCCYPSTLLSCLNIFLGSRLSGSI